MTRRQIAKSEIDLDKGIVRTKYANGQVLEVKVNELPPASLRLATLVGIRAIKQGAYGNVNGSADAAYDASRAAVTRLHEGTYTLQANRTIKISELAQAVSRVQGTPPADTERKLRTFTASQREQIRSIPEVKSALLAIRQEQLAEAPSTGPTLADLGL